MWPGLLGSGWKSWSQAEIRDLSPTFRGETRTKELGRTRNFSHAALLGAKKSDIGP